MTVGLTQEETALRHQWAAEELSHRRYEARMTRYLAGDGQRGAAPKRFIDLHKDAARGRIICGANRSAKSSWGTVEALWWLLGAHPFRTTPTPPVYGRIIVPDLPLSNDDPHAQRDLFREWAPPHELRGGAWETAYSVRGCTLHFRNGSFVEFCSSKQDVQQQAGASHLAFSFFDEEVGREHWVENIARLDRPGAAWWFCYAPLEREPWIHDQLFAPASKGDLPDVTLITAGMADNAHNLDENFLRHMMSSLSPADLERRVHGRYAAREGLVFDVPVETVDSDALLKGLPWAAPNEDVGVWER